jgi:hypothetical protein
MRTDGMWPEFIPPAWATPLSKDESVADDLDGQG